MTSAVLLAAYLILKGQENGAKTGQKGHENGAKTGQKGHKSCKKHDLFFIKHDMVVP